MFILLVACGSGKDDTGLPAVDSDVPAPLVGDCEWPCETLSEYNFFVGDLAELTPAEGVLPYEPAAKLWSDNAGKSRFLFVPPGETITFHAEEEWDYPLGSILVKSFWFADDLAAPDGPRRHIETRLLLREEEGWTGHIYLWNDEQTDAERYVAGTRVDVTYTDHDGVDDTHEYIVPNTNQCINCHGRDDTMHLLGPVTPQLNRPNPDGTGNQLETFAESGLFDAELPDVSSLHAFEDPFGDGAVDRRARAWLHANCAHCHRAGGGGGSTGLVLLEWEEEPINYGVCRSPVAAGAGAGGFEYDIAPRDPDASIMIYRVNSIDPAIKMPELPNQLVATEAVALLRDWIAAMDEPDCPQ